MAQKVPVKVVKLMKIFTMAFVASILLASATRPSRTFQLPWSPRRGVWPEPRKLIDKNVDGPNTSQMVFDPWSFTHVTHGVLGYVLYRGICRVLKVTANDCATHASKAFAVLFVLELVWEMVENSNYVVDRYRKSYRKYKGDSLVNSLGDIYSCLLGFFMASWNMEVALFYVFASEYLLWPNGLIGGVSTVFNPPTKSM